MFGLPYVSLPSLPIMLKPHIFQTRGAFLEGPDNSGSESCSLHLKTIHFFAAMEKLSANKTKWIRLLARYRTPAFIP